MMQAGGGYFDVSLSLLNEWIPLPEGVNIVHAETHWEWGRQSLRVYVSGEGLPQVPEGVRLPEIVPTFRKGEDGKTTFAGWLGDDPR